MNFTELAAKATKYVFPFLKKNKAVSQITKEIGEATNTSLIELWDWIKPIFIEEFEEEDENKENESVITHEIKKKLKKAESSQQQQFLQLIKQLEEDAANNRLPKQNTIKIKGNNNIAIQDAYNSQININSPKTDEGNN